jgi:hypothetical protein
MRGSQDCASLAVEARLLESPTRPLVVLTSKGEVKAVRAMVAVGLPVGSTCYGSTWKAPSGHTITVKVYEDALPGFPGGFDLQVCGGGQAVTDAERKELKRWRNAVK